MKKDKIMENKKLSIKANKLKYEILHKGNIPAVDKIRAMDLLDEIRILLSRKL